MFDGILCFNLLFPILWSQHCLEWVYAMEEVLEKKEITKSLSQWSMQSHKGTYFETNI